MHGTGHSHAHSHGPDRAANSRRMWQALAINAAMVVLSVVGAIVTGSLALFADAGHVLSDVLAIALGIFAAKVAQRPPGGRGTFGMGRVEILVALINGLALVAVAVFVAVEAIGRFSDPPDVSGAGVLLFGVFGLLGNALATWVLVRGDRSDVNLEGVLRHSLADALGSLGVVLAGLGIMITGVELLDPVIGLAIAVLILLSSWRLIREPVEVLLERAPEGFDVAEIGQAIAAIDGVREVHDLHIWSITSGFPALAAHVTVSATSDVTATRRAIEQMLEHDYELSHTTLQVTAEELLQIDE
ncbi:MAG: cation diffusion facilitator family transporter [Solirubrobacterales bacterium]